VKYFSWSPEKNQELLSERGISFEEIVFHIEQGHVRDLVRHPNQEKYPDQRVFVVNVGGYAYLVPFVENDREVFLKTIIPSRKATREYLGGPS
jgi:uncharacterized DUF497 family protein